MNKKTTKQFISDAKKVHSNKYDYRLVDYKNNKTKVKIICRKCGLTFVQRPNDHLGNHGCPKCSESQLEKQCRMFLTKNKIRFTCQKKFKKLQDKKLLSYDFYIPSRKILIECNGIQHYKFVSVFQKAEHDFHRQLHHDWLKREFARKNGYNLLVIKFDDDLEARLSSVFTKTL